MPKVPQVQLLVYLFIETHSVIIFWETARQFIKFSITDFRHRDHHYHNLTRTSVNFYFQLGCNFYRVAKNLWNPLQLNLQWNRIENFVYHIFISFPIIRLLLIVNKVSIWSSKNFGNGRAKDLGWSQKLGVNGQGLNHDYSWLLRLISLQVKCWRCIR